MEILRTKRRLASEINVVPYIDVMLVLLIIFMVTAPLMTSGVEVDLPETDNSTASVQSDEEPVVLTVDKNGLMYMDVGAKHYDEPMDEDEVIATASRVAQSNPDKTFYVRADRNVPFGPVLRAMDLLKQAGATRASFASMPEDIEQR